MARSLVIDLGKDLPARPGSLGDGAMSQVWGGCNGEGQRCMYDSDCCPLVEYGGGGKTYLRCIRTAGHQRQCLYA